MKGALIVCAVIVAYGIAGRMDAEDEQMRDIERKEMVAWLHENCIASQPFQRGVTEMNSDGSIQCSKYENAGTHRVPRLLFAEVRKWKP